MIKKNAWIMVRSQSFFGTFLHLTNIVSVDEGGMAAREIINDPAHRKPRPRRNDHLKGSPRAIYPALANNMPHCEIGITKDKSYPSRSFSETIIEPRNEKAVSIYNGIFWSI
jgi:hypothetical protein